MAAEISLLSISKVYCTINNTVGTFESLARFKI
jgi:hypothetical protein